MDLPRQALPFVGRALPLVRGDNWACACSNSSISRARSVLCSTTECAHRPISTPTATTIRVDTAVSPRNSADQPSWSQLPSSVVKVASPRNPMEILGVRPNIQ